MAELRAAVRALRSTPFVTAAAVLSLALGIGANTAIFSLLNAALLRPLPIDDPERLVIVDSANHRHSSWPQPVWAEVRNRQILERGFAWFWSRFDTSERGERQFVDGIAASGRMFESLGIRPILGRLLTPADDQLEGGPDGLVRYCCLCCCPTSGRDWDPDGARCCTRECRPTRARASHQADRGGRRVWACRKRLDDAVHQVDAVQRRAGRHSDVGRIMHRANGGRIPGCMVARASGCSHRSRSRAKGRLLMVGRSPRRSSRTTPRNLGPHRP